MPKIEDIEKKFIEGYIETTLQMLVTATEDDYEVNINLKGSLNRWNSLEDTYNSGTLDFSDFEQEKAKIRKEIIEIFKKIRKGDIKLSDAATPNNPKTAQNAKILFLAANPFDTTRLQLDKEVREIDTGLRLGSQRDKFELKPEFAVTVDSLMQAFLRENPAIVHFSGHGEPKQTTIHRGKEIDLGGLVVNGRNDEMHVIGTDALEALFETFHGTIKCVLLNACYSAQQGQAIKKHVDYVIGMNREMYDDSAIAFAVGFYKALGEGKDYEFAFKMGVTSIRLNGLKGANIPVLLK